LHTSGHARRKRSPTGSTTTTLLHFRLDQLPANLLVSAATLHLKLRRTTGSSSADAAAVKIRLIQLIEGDEGIVLDSVQLPPRDDDAATTDDDAQLLVQFDVSHAVQAWLLDPEANNKGLHVETGPETEVVIDPTDDVTDGGGPHITVEAESGRVPLSVYRLRSKRSLFLSSKPALAAGGAALTAGRTDCRAGRSPGGPCCRQHMTVKLRELEGFGFIMQPAEFDAFYCRGKCPPRYLPRNDHSLLQSLLHLKSQREGGGGRARIKQPCCNPSKFESIDILHLDEMDPTRLKVTHWKNIIVSECACA
jgi:integrin beta 8